MEKSLMQSDYCSGKDDSEPPGRVLKLVQQHSAEHSSLDDQLPRCLQVLRQIYAMYYDDDDQPSSIGGNGAIHPVQLQSVQQQPEHKNPTHANSTSTSSSLSSSSSLNADNNKQPSSVSAPAPVTTTTTPLLYHNQLLANRSVATILRGLKREVLAGCTITFSGIVNLKDCPVPQEQHMLWRLAESLGAQVW
jgi:hypothetical protein